MIALLAVSLTLATPLAQDVEAPDARILASGFRHLGDDETPEWTEAAAAPEGDRFDLVFEAGQNAVEHVLLLRHRSVNDLWTVSVNGTVLGALPRGDALASSLHLVPAGVLSDGTNTLSVVPDSPTDDITIGDVRLVPRPLRDVLDLAPVSVRVREKGTLEPLPARVTIADAAGELVPIHYGEAPTTAVRDGVVYTSRGAARFEVPRGDYRVWATRGSEWGLAAAEISVGVGEEHVEVVLELAREVDTTGYLAADTHIHTFTFSGHGDSSVPERLVTLAGEGVELAVATDHNHNTDYTGAQADLGLSERFTAVTGNEVSTPVGHFNAFPLDPHDEVPEHESSDWTLLVDDMRAKGAGVVILNHPRWPARDTGPFATTGLDRFTGARAEGTPYLFDAMELVNSTTEEDDALYLFHDWFALLNRGEPIVAVGSSDSHTVGMPVGAGRTYVRSSTDDVSAIDVDEAAANIAAGRSTIAMGIFTDIVVDGQHGPGDLAPATTGVVEVAVRVATPTWVRPRELHVFVDGARVATHAIEVREGEPTDVVQFMPLELASDHDVWIVAVVEGDPIDGPYWPLVNDYTLGATNPVYLDVDGDGSSSPRDVARALLAQRGVGMPPPDEVDGAVALQYLELLEERLVDDARRAAREAAAERASWDAQVRGWLESREAGPR